MELKIESKVNEEVKPKDTYEIVVSTMEGDADDYHDFSLEFKNDEEGLEDLRNCVIFLEAANKSYPNGRGGCDSYSGIIYWEDYFSDNWFSDCNEGCEDSLESFEIFYYNINGEKYNVQYTLDDDMKKIIKKNIIKR